MGESSEKVTCNFPLLLRPHPTNRTTLFLDYGSNKNIDVRWNEEKEAVEVIGQHDHWSDNRGMYAANQPSLPLTWPNPVSDPTCEPIMSDINSTNDQMRKFILLMDMERSALKYSIEKQAAMKSILHELRSKVCDYGIRYGRRSRIKGVARLAHGILGKEHTFKIANMNYNGGCIKYQPLGPISPNPDFIGYILYPSGPELNVLTMSHIELSQGGVLRKSKEQSQATVNDRIFQICTVNRRGKYHCAVRSCDSVTVYCILPSSKEPIKCLGSHSFSSETPTSICLSPFLPGECLMVTTAGNLYLWKATDCPVLVHEGLCPRFTVNESWFNCEFGGHPRMAIISDPSGMALLDISCIDSEPVDIFTLPHQCLHPDERITASCSIPSHRFYHILATHYSVILLDERLPDHPLLQWSHCLQHPPIYLSPGATPQHTCHLLVSTQMNAETLVYEFHLGDHKTATPPQSTHTVFRASKMDDFALIAAHHKEGALPVVVEKKLSVPLAGCCYVPNPASAAFSVMQISGFGDVFSQDFYHQPCVDKTVEVTQSYGPGMTYNASKLPQRNSPDHLDWRDWLEEAHQQLVSCRGKNLKRPHFNASDAFLEMMHTPYPHVLCPLCMPLAGINDQSQASTDPSADSCYACGHSLHQMAQVVQAIQQDKVTPSISEVKLPHCLNQVDVEKHLADTSVPAPPVEGVDMSDEGVGRITHPLSAIILKLWNGDYNVEEEVLQRDQMIKAGHKLLLKKYMAGSTSQSSSDDDDDNDDDDDDDEREDGDKTPDNDTVTASVSSAYPCQLSSLPWVDPSGSLHSDSSNTSHPTSRPRKRHHSETSNASSIDSLLQATPGFLTTPTRLQTPPRHQSATQEGFLASPVLFNTSSFSPVTPRSKAKPKRTFVVGF